MSSIIAINFKAKPDCRNSLIYTFEQLNKSRHAEFISASPEACTTMIQGIPKQVRNDEIPKSLKLMTLDADVNNAKSYITNI